MGLQLPPRVAAPAKRVATIAVLGLALMVLGACSAEDSQAFKNIAMPDPATEQGTYTLDLWRYAWLAAMVVGVITWGLIIFVIWRFRRGSDDEVPVQTRYNLPLEIFYTIAPVLMVIAFFYWTVNVQDEMTAIQDDPDVVVDVVGQQWSWTFNYTEQGADGTTPYAVGTTEITPTLVLPVDQTVEFKLHSPDVIHSFGVPAFLTKLDVIPGRVNRFQVTPTEIGEYPGKCFELCGVYHSKMLFNVEVVSQEDYAAYLADLEEQGSVADEPLLGGANARTQAGLDDEEGGEE